MVRSEKSSNTFVSGEQHRRVLAKSGVTVVAHITKDRELVAWAQGTSRAVYIAAGIIEDGTKPVGATRLDHKLTRRRNMTA